MNRKALRIIEWALAISIVYFVLLALIGCNRPATFNESGIEQCRGVDWHGVTVGTIVNNADIPLPPLTPSYCTRFLFSSENTSVATVKVEVSVVDPEGGEDWLTLYEIINPKDPEGWSGMADDVPYRIRVTGYVAGTIHYAVFQAKPRTP